MFSVFNLLKYIYCDYYGFYFMLNMKYCISMWKLVDS